MSDCKEVKKTRVPNASAPLSSLPVCYHFFQGVLPICVDGICTRWHCHKVNRPFSPPIRESRTAFGLRSFVWQQYHIFWNGHGIPAVRQARQYQVQEGVYYEENQWIFIITFFVLRKLVLRASTHINPVPAFIQNAVFETYAIAAMNLFCRVHAQDRGGLFTYETFQYTGDEDERW